MVFFHQVWLQWKPSATPSQVAAFGDAVLALKASIPEILHISVGSNVTKRTPHHSGLLVVFARAEHLPLYDQHPSHQAVVKQHVLPLREAVNALDFECDAALSGEGLFSHQVWFDLSGASDEHIAAAQQGLLGMKATVPGIVDIAFGKNVTARTPHTHGLLVTFRTEAEYAAYEPHEGHLSVVKAAVRPIMKAVAALDYHHTPAPDKLTLVIGNRNYSSWSLRPWLLLRHLCLAFDEHDVAVLGKGPNEGLKPLSPSGLVPVLRVQPGDGAAPIAVHETVAIAEWLHERYPGRGVWPADRAARAMARSVSAEMAAGFGALRAEMPCNIKCKTRGYPTPFPPALAGNIARIEELVVAARERFGAPSGAGPFLFGAYCAADGMYAPVATRFRTYNVALKSEVAAAYFAALLVDEHFLAWEAAALGEEARGLALAHYDAMTLEKGGPPRE